MDVQSVKSAKAQLEGQAGAAQEKVTGFLGQLQGLLKPERASRQVRRFLAEAYGFLRGTQSIGEFGSYGLEQAIAARIEEIEGKPRNPGKLNRIQRIDKLLASTALVVAAASTLSEEDLGSETISGLGSSHVAADGFAGNLGKALSTLDKVQGAVDKAKAAPGELSDQLNSAKGKATSAAMQGAESGLQKAKDVGQEKAEGLV